MERTKTFVNGGRIFPADINVIEDRAAEMLEGTAAAIPSSHYAGRYYRATDTGDLYLDNGTTWEKIAGKEAIKEANLGPESVSAAKIKSSAVTEAKIASGAVTSAKLASVIILPAKTGFFGGTEITKPSLSESSTTAQIVKKLGEMGLVTATP